MRELEEKRQAGAETEIEITPEMIEAVVMAYDDYCLEQQLSGDWYPNPDAKRLLHLLKGRLNFHAQSPS